MAIVRQAAHHGSEKNSWLGRKSSRKSEMLVAVAIANNIARVAWVLMARGGIYQSPVAAWSVGMRWSQAEVCGRKSSMTDLQTS
jgi:hypothetical protein